MAPRLTVAIAVGAASCAMLAGCGARTGTPTVSADSPSRYVDTVQALLDPPAQLASAIAERTSDPAAPAPGRSRLDDLVSAARTRLAQLRGLQLRDPGLRRDRDRLAAAYSRLVPRMRAAADALVGGDRARLRAAAGPFLDSLRTLPSGASSS